MAMVSQMQIASNKAINTDVLSECVNLANAATGNEDYILIEGAFSLDTTTPG